MMNAVNTVSRKLLDEDKLVAKKFPKRPDSCSSNNLKILLSLLQPLQIVTDRLQTEKTSISIVIMSCLDAFESEYNCYTNNKKNINLVFQSIIMMFL
jgi:hypothetical protein